MLILEGPPGTGKTYRAAREAVATIDGNVTGDVIARYRQLVDAGRIVPVTFHPSYSYEDFVEGYRPRVKDDVMRYPVVDGPFLRAIKRVREQVPISTAFHVGMAVPTASGEPYTVEEVQPGGLVLSRPNNRADAVNDVNYYYAPFWTVARILDRGVNPNDVAVAGSNYDARRNVARNLEFPPDQLAGMSHIAAVARVLSSQTDEYVAADQDVVVVIDEINRADLSRVFGELITLVEVDKREHAAEERSAVLPYSGEVLTVPAALHIIGTMNTADRSLSVFDYALRRRFSFEYVAPDSSLCPDAYGAVDVAGWLGAVNERIVALLDREACLGHAEFMLGRLERRRSELDESDDADGQVRAFAAAIAKYAIPTLLAITGRDWNVVRAILGSDLVQEDLGVDVELDEFEASASWYRLSPECDPDGPDWTPAAFRAAILRLAGSSETVGAADRRAADAVGDDES
jgi:5-methylcytosine-specific restriction protein B